MEKQNGFFLTQHQFETLRNRINSIGEELEGIEKIYNLLHLINIPHELEWNYEKNEDINEENWKKSALVLNLSQIQILRDFLDSIIGLQSDLLEDVWVDDEEIDRQRHFAFHKGE